MEKLNYSFVIIRHDFILGGTYSLTHRIFSWCNLNGIDTFWIKTKGLEVSGNIIESFRTINTHIVDVEPIKFSYYSDFQKIPHLNFSSKNIIILTFDFNEFLLGESIRKRYTDCNIKNLLYIVHPKIYEPLNIGYKAKFIGHVFFKISKVVKKHYISRLIETNSIIFMSTLDYLSCLKSLNIVSNNKKYNVIRLSIAIPPIDTNQIIKKYSSKTFNIISISRLDFPFKGYLVGLIDNFINLKISYPKITLTIIGDGPGKDEILSKISNNKLHNDINYIENVPYDEIESFLRKSHLHIGMGTTILDASKFGVISVIALSFQTEDKAIGFFHNNVELLGANIKEYKGNIYSFYSLIEEVINYSKSEFVDYSLKSYNIVESDYNINSAMKNIFDIKCNESLKYSLLFCNLSKIFNLTLFFIINIKKKLDKKILKKNQMTYKI